MYSDGRKAQADLSLQPKVAPQFLLGEVHFHHIFLTCYCIKAFPNPEQITDTEIKMIRKHLVAIMTGSIVMAVFCGCSTVYKAAVDERNVRTIVSDDKIVITILKRFHEDESIKVLDISADCYSGHVYLVGEYETQNRQAVP